MAFRHADIFKLSGDTFSPLKVPLNQWSFGSGLIFSIGSFLYSKNPNYGALLLGWIFNIIFWWAFIGILHYVAKANIVLTFFGVCIAFVGTPIGFYSSAYSSESLSYSCLALMFYWILTQKKWKTIDFLFVGILSGLLIIIRPQLAIYCTPIYGIICYHIIEKLKERVAIKTYIIPFFSLLPAILSIIPVLLVNRWMTGSAFGSTYVFSSNSFKSVEWGNPELLAVLIHPWHGLLSYHPLYALSFISIILLIFYQRSLLEKLFILVLTLVLIFHFYLQASWYAWWLGTGTFGMRGLSIGAIILVPALIHFLSIRDKHHFSNNIWYLLIFLSCCWSFLLLLQNKNEYTQFFTYEQLLSAQYNELIALFSSQFIFFLILVLIIGIAIWPNREKNCRPYQYLMTLVLFFMILYYQFFKLELPQILESPFSYPFLRGIQKAILTTFHLNLYVILPPFLLGIQTILTLLVPFFVRNILLSPNHETHPSIIKRVTPYTYIGLFCIITFLFTRLALNTEKYIASGTTPNRTFKYISSVDIKEVEIAYEDYLRVPGFEKKKLVLHNYLITLKEKASISQNSGEKF